jgi:hypothetical protein
MADSGHGRKTTRKEEKRAAIKSNKEKRTYENWEEGRKGSTIWDKKNCISSEE